MGLATAERKMQVLSRSGPSVQGHRIVPDSHSQSASQSVSRSVNQSVSQSVSQSDTANQSQSVSQPVIHAVG